MIRNLANFTNWIGGCLLALAGTVVAYWPVPADTAVWTLSGGRLLGLAGLGWIAIGISRRAARRTHES